MVLSVVAAAYGLSAMGDQMAIVALTLRLHDEGRSGYVLSLLVVASVLPLVVVGPLAGPLVDRIESSRLIMTVTALQAVVALGLALTTDTVVAVLLLALLGCGAALALPALQLLVPQITGEEATARGYARLETFRAVGNIAGPALAGLLVAVWDARIALAVNAASFALLGTALAAVGVRRRPVAVTTRPGWLGQVREGVRVLGADRLLRTAIGALACAIVFTAILVVARVFFIRDDLGASDAGYGVLVTAHTVGMLLTSAFLAPRVPLAWQPRVLVCAGLLMGASLLLSAAVPVLPVVVVAFALAGVANSLQSLSIRNLIHARVPAGVRGRAFASSGAVLNGANMAGTALGGPAAVALGGAGALQLAGAGTLLASLAAGPMLFRRAVDEAGPAGTCEEEDPDNGIRLPAK
ncbi:hypothetical protein AMK16_02050 [Streptomyces sp. CB00455]|nr:hypothetical protein AMK16_02050 [Streptomyces sp. CB00455]